MGLLPSRRRTGDSGCREVAEEGNGQSACALRSACTVREKVVKKLSHKRQSTRPSLGPLTRARLSPLQLRRGNSRRWRARFPYRGRENLGNQEEPAPGRGQADDVRLAASHRFRKGEGEGRKKRKAITVVVPARIVGARAQCPFVVAVAEIGRRRLAPNKLGKRAPKRAVRVE